MPDQVLRYRVELDDSDLSSQLSAIRDKINSEVSSFTAASMAGTPVIQPQTIEGFQTAPAPAVFTIPNDVSSQIYTPPQFAGSAFGTIGQESFPVIPPASTVFHNQGIGNLEVFNDMNTQAAVLMRSTQQNVGTSLNTISTDMQNFASNSYQGLQNMMPSMEQGSFLSNALAGFGVGYDQRMPMFLKDYKATAQQETADTLQNVGESVGMFGSDLGIAGVGMLAGAALGGPVGWAIGGIGLAKAAVDYFAVDDLQALRETADGVRQIGVSQLGAFSKADAFDVVNNMRDYSLSKEGFLSGTSMADLESTVMTFTSAGGLSNTRTADDLKQKVDEVMQNFRQVMHVLGTTQEEAASIMAEFERRNMLTPAQMPNFASEMTVKAGFAGMAPTDLISYGLGTAEMFRGTGMDSQTAYNFGIDAAVEVGRMTNSLDPYYRQNIYDLGGQSAATEKLIQNMMGYVNNTPSGQNLILGAGYTGPEYLTKDIFDQLNDLAGAFAEGGIGGYYEARAKGLSVLDGLSPKTLAGAQIAQIYSLAKSYGATDADGNISEDTLSMIGVDWFRAHGMPNLTMPEFKEILNLGRTSPESNESMESSIAVNSMLAKYASQDYTFTDYMKYQLKEMVPDFISPVGEWLDKAYYDVGKTFANSYKNTMDNLTGSVRILQEDWENVDSNIMNSLISGKAIQRLDALNLNIDASASLDSGGSVTGDLKPFNSFLEQRNIDPTSWNVEKLAAEFNYDIESLDAYVNKVSRPMLASNEMRTKGALEDLLTPLQGNYDGGYLDSSLNSYLSKEINYLTTENLTTDPNYSTVRQALGQIDYSGVSRVAEIFSAVHDVGGGNSALYGKTALDMPVRTQQMIIREVMSNPDTPTEVKEKLLNDIRKYEENVNTGTDYGYETNGKTLTDTQLKKVNYIKEKTEKLLKSPNKITEEFNEMFGTDYRAVGNDAIMLDTKKIKNEKGEEYTFVTGIKSKLTIKELIAMQTSEKDGAEGVVNEDLMQAGLDLTFDAKQSLKKYKETLSDLSNGKHLDPEDIINPIVDIKNKNKEYYNQINAITEDKNLGADEKNVKRKELRNKIDQNKLSINALEDLAVSRDPKTGEVTAKFGEVADVMAGTIAYTAVMDDPAAQAFIAEIDRKLQTGVIDEKEANRLKQSFAGKIASTLQTSDFQIKKVINDNKQEWFDWKNEHPEKVNEDEERTRKNFFLNKSIQEEINSKVYSRIQNVVGGRVEPQNKAEYAFLQNNPIGMEQIKILNIIATNTGKMAGNPQSTGPTTTTTPITNRYGSGVYTKEQRN